jgi:glycosidase
MMAFGCKPKDHHATPVGDSFVVPEVADVVMYQVNPRVFAAENSFQAIINRLDSIQDLGVNMLWIMPIYPIGQEKSKNSPYSVKDYKAVAPEYGTVDDLRQLVESCHERGMGVILDWVANHTAWDNVWLQQHPDWYTHDSTGNIIFPPGTDWTDVADLNYDNKDMRAAMIDAMRYWVDSVGVDGFRCDVADQVPVDFWTECIDNLRAAAKPRNLIMLAERETTRPKLHMRMPLIAGLNDDDDLMARTADFYRLHRILRVTLLPYHSLGVSKARHIGGRQERFEAPPPERVEAIRKLFEESGLQAEISGIGRE